MKSSGYERHKGASGQHRLRSGPIELETLAPYAIEIRYPGAALDVSQEEAQEALATMEVLWSFILALIHVEGII